MRAQWPLLATILSVGVAYAAYPYVELYRLGLAIQVADSTTLETLVDWPAVREGIKEDVCDLVADDPGLKASSDLPAFGASFTRGIASRAIDQAVTPQALLAATTTLPAAHSSPHGANVHVSWAFFGSATTFLVSLSTSGQTEPIKLEMELQRGKWRVQRVWLPAQMLSPKAKT